ncbi:two-component response regulator-like APRR2 isoform X2 [Coffea eugenioides]|uniref:two-component response regulator-like APRR2 isoform X2 n=1 Tax=Coffea eugenioides TaxID=49369 RepID=UPI000F608664|nr:two-component response regulator-like APRR2 isoform X2 [Coffea eugenioides]
MFDPKFLMHLVLSLSCFRSQKCCKKEDAMPAMVCTADELLGWKDFPKGLKVLLIESDACSAVEMRLKLEEMDYIVSIFCNENEALSAISNKSECFHVAIVEVNTQNSSGIFKFLETANDLPTIMISDNNCRSTMMKCIALGAVEFLQKPVSDDKLQNIWQHVVHKQAFNAGGKDVSEALKPVKESLISMLQLQFGNAETGKQASVEAEQENNQDLLSGCDKYPAPSTPQLKQGERSLDDGDCQDQANFSMEQDSAEQDGECKSVETTCGNSIFECTALGSPASGEDAVKEEHESTNCCRTEINTTTCYEGKDRPSNKTSNAAGLNRSSAVRDTCGIKASKKRSKVDWTPELHKKFVQAVEQLGIDQAIPSRILELMKVEGLTRHNVASHLQQKYRMHRRHILPKENERRWPHPGGSAQRNYYPHKPVMAFPPYHPNHTIPGGQVYPAWIPPGTYTGGIHIWGSPYYPGWQVPNESWYWKPYSVTHADAWGCPVMPQTVGSYPQFAQTAPDFQTTKEMQYTGSTLLNPSDLHAAEEVIDQVVKEAISKPWLPLPLGLKPPSTECVLNELSKQGISKIPPHTNAPNIR